MVSYRINRQERLLTLRCSGLVTAREWREALLRAIQEVPEVLRFETFSDIRGCQTLPTSDEVREFNEFLNEVGMQASSRRSVVLAGRPAHVGMSRMLEIIGEQQSRVARLTTTSLHTAAEHLGRPEALLAAELEALKASDEAKSAPSPTAS
jgi:hypothetical protein